MNAARRSTVVLAILGLGGCNIIFGINGGEGGAAGGGSSSSTTTSSSSTASSGVTATSSTSASSTSTSASSASSSSSSASSSSSSGLPTILLGSIATSGDNADIHAGGVANVNSYTAIASGTVGHLSVWLMPGGDAVNVYVGLYANDSGGGPGTLLTSGLIPSPSWATVSAAGGAWLTASVPPVAVTSGATYWIGIVSPAGEGSVNFGYHGSASTSLWEHSASSVLPALPAQWTPSATMFGNSTECSMYASP